MSALCRHLSQACVFVTPPLDFFPPTLLLWRLLLCALLLSALNRVRCAIRRIRRTKVAVTTGAGAVGVRAPSWFRSHQMPSYLTTSAIN